METAQLVVVLLFILLPVLGMAVVAYAFWGPFRRLRPLPGNARDTRQGLERRAADHGTSFDEESRRLGRIQRWESNAALVTGAFLLVVAGLYGGRVVQVAPTAQQAGSTFPFWVLAWSGFVNIGFLAVMTIAYGIALRRWGPRLLAEARQASTGANATAKDADAIAEGTT